MKIYLDDCRVPPVGWTLAKTAEEVLVLLRQGGVEELSLDHDLGFYEVSPGVWREDKLAPDGTWLVKTMVREGLWPATKPLVHSANDPAAKRMRNLIDDFFGRCEPDL